MAVTDKEKENIKEYVYSDTASFKNLLLECLKNDDVQKSVFSATVKGAFLRYTGLLFVVFLMTWVGSSLPTIQEILPFI